MSTLETSTTAIQREYFMRASPIQDSNVLTFEGLEHVAIIQQERHAVRDAVQQ
jgi:hypothetical protein